MDASSWNREMEEVRTYIADLEAKLEKVEAHLLTAEPGAKAQLEKRRDYLQKCRDEAAEDRRMLRKHPQEQSVERVKEPSLSPGADEGAKPVTINLFVPDGEPEEYWMTFKNPHHFEKFLDRSSIICLFNDGKAPGIDEFSELEERALYTTAVRNVPARVKNLEMYKEHLVRRRDVYMEFAHAIMDDLHHEGIPAEVLEAERTVQGNRQQHVAETDIVVQYIGQPGFVIGSMKTYVSGTSDIGNLQKTIQEHYSNRAPFDGKPIQAAFMSEVVKPGVFEQLKDACRKERIRLYTRNGRSISRVQLRAPQVTVLRTGRRAGTTVPCDLPCSEEVNAPGECPG